MKSDNRKRRQESKPKDYRKYEQRWKNSSKRFRDEFKIVLKMIRKFLKRNPEHKSMLCVLATYSYSCTPKFVKV